MSMEFRKAQAEDIATLQHLAHQNINTFYRDILGDAGVDRFLNSGSSDRYIANNIDHCTVMYRGHDDDAIVGFAVCKGDMITLLMVATEAHRQGLGSQLLSHCEEQLLRTFDHIRLESFEGNTRGNSFYEKNQWSLLQRKTDEESGVNKYIYIKRTAG